jgi:hypothetical protein
MAVANIAWILASHGRRVLVIDWDLEAPGLHRYFHPFLADKELENSPGLIDFFVEFASAAPRRGATGTAPSDDRWWEPHADLLRCTTSLEWDFPDEGTIDFVPAGRQDAGYPLRVTGFNWPAFYRELGGGVFLEAVKARLRNSYDYVLVDSRTGISDTAGICTVQIPDDLVVCFTLNQQSIKGAAAVAASADSQRRKAHGEPGLRVWPVPTRVELGEKERLDVACERARRTFDAYIRHLSREERAAYWEGVEVLYQPYYAYEEVLAVFAERRRQRGSLLTSFEQLTRYVTDGDVTELGRMGETARLAGLEKFTQRRQPASPQGPACLVYSSRARAIGSRIGAALHRASVPFLDVSESDSDESQRQRIETALVSSGVTIGLIERERSDSVEFALTRARRHGLRIVPVIAPGADVADVPEEIAGSLAFRLRESNLDSDVQRLAVRVRDLLVADAQNEADLDPDDDQKGRWGGSPEANGRHLSAKVSEISKDWFQIVLEVAASDGGERSLEGEVSFHLHSTFPRPTVTVPAVNGVAQLGLRAWGAFTVGAVADEGRTCLELDLSLDRSYPARFRER